MGNHFFQYNDYVTLLKSRKETSCNHAFFRDKCVSSCTCWLVQGSLSNATTTKMAAIKTKTNNPARASYCLICYFFVFSFNVLLRTWKIHQHLTNWTTWNKSHKFPPLVVVVVFLVVREGVCKLGAIFLKWGRYERDTTSPLSVAVWWIQSVYNSFVSLHKNISNIG